MSEKEQLKRFIHQLPNAVSGDGKAFVAQLKKALSYLSEHAGGSGSGEDGGEGEDVVNQVTGLRLVEVHTVDSSGFPKNNIEVTFDNSNISNYAFAQIWVKDDTENTYQQHGNTNGTRYLLENVLVGRTYTVKVIVQLKDGRTSDFDNAPTASILIQGSVLIPDAPTQFFLTWDEDGALWQWQYEENEYIDFFELRLDANAGVYNDKLLDRTRLSYSRVSPDVRSGTAYLFVRNIFGDYSTPATHIFNKPVGAKPNKPVLQSTLDGVVITMSPLPTGYQGYVLEIDGEEFKTINRQFVYYKFSGTVKARYCYYDEIGRGEWSEYETITIKVTLDPDELPEISYDAFDQTIKDAIDAVTEQAGINEQIKADVEEISSSIDEIQSKVEENSSAIIQTDARIETVVTQKVTVAKGEVKGEILDEIGDDIKDEVTKEVGSQIKQEADNITATVYEQVKGEISSEVAAQVKIEADEIKSTVYKKTEVDEFLNDKANKADVYTKTETASQITQSADEIKSLVNKEVEALDGKITNINSSVTQNTDKIALAVSKIDTIDSNVKQNTSLIQLTNDSITSVVAELNKNPEDCSYSAITQLKSGIDLSVKSEDFNGKEIISRINITPEVITIDGKYVHVTGDTVFDNDVIVGGYIKADTINTDHLQTNAVTTAKIAANAITADKIEAGAITNEKITDKSISSVKIEDGAITTTQIKDGAISSTKIEGGAITTEHIQAGSIIGEHISAGAVSADKFYAGDISMEGALALVGGAVRLDETGLTCVMDSGYALFDAQGITFFDTQGYSYGQIRQMCIGTAAHGSRVTFAGEWHDVPSVVCVPTELQVGVKEYTQSDVYMVCRAVNVTKRGFDVQCYTKLGSGSVSTNPINESFDATANSGSAYEYEIGSFHSDGPTDVEVVIEATTSATTWGQHGKNDITTYWYHTCTIELYNNGELLVSSGRLARPSYPDAPSATQVTNKQVVAMTLKGVVDSLGTLSLNIIPYSSQETTSYKPSVTIPIQVVSVGYVTEEEVPVSTGTALFVATTNSNIGFTISNGGATYGLRKQVRQG